MKRGLDFEKAQAALKRPAEKAIHGTREERTGRFETTQQLGHPIREANASMIRVLAIVASSVNARRVRWAKVQIAVGRIGETQFADPTGPFLRFNSSLELPIRTNMPLVRGSAF